MATGMVRAWGSRAAWVLAVWCAATLAQAQGRAAPPGAPRCGEVITAASAQLIFQKLTALHQADGCVMNGLATRDSTMRVTWNRAGVATPEIVVTPTACAGGGAAASGPYAIQGGEAFAAVCPATLAALRRTLAQDAPAPTHLTSGSPRRTGRYGRAAIALALALGLLGASLWRRRSRGTASAAPGDAG